MEFCSLGDKDDEHKLWEKLISAAKNGRTGLGTHGWAGLYGKN